MSALDSHQAVSVALGRQICTSFGLPDDAGAVLGALLIDADEAASLDDLESTLRRPIGRLGLSVDLLRRLGAIERSRRRAPGASQGIPGLRDLLCRLSAAYRQGGMEALEAVHWKRREVSLAYRSLIRILQTICPLDALAAFGAQMNRDLHECSLWEASTQALSRLAIPWEVDVPCEAREIIRTRALIVYGNHPSMLSPFLVAAALERDDLKLISCRYVARLIPNLEGDIFPLDPTYERSVREGLRSGVSHMLAMAALYRFDEPRDIAAARLENRASILKAAEHVSRGGATLIFPGGGRERDWYPGLGTLVAEALRHHADPGIYLVPVHEANSSNVRLYRALAGRSSRREPVRLVAATPRSVSEYGFSTSTEPGRIVATLRADYYETFTS